MTTPSPAPAQPAQRQVKLGQMLAFIGPCVPFAALGAISVPKDQQVASGIVVLVLFVFGLVLLSSNSGLEKVPVMCPSKKT